MVVEKKKITIHAFKIWICCFLYSAKWYLL